MLNKPEWIATLSNITIWAFILKKSVSLTFRLPKFKFAFQGKYYFAANILQYIDDFYVLDNLRTTALGQ